jgi:hypothetical protein
MKIIHTIVSFVILNTILAGCSQHSVINPDNIEIPEGSAGHYFIQKALDDDWFAYVKRCENGVVSIEIIAEEKFILNLDKGAYCESIGGIWNTGSCFSHGNLIYVSPELHEVDKNPQKIYQLYQKGAMQSCQQWLEAVESIEFNSKGRK